MDARRCRQVIGTIAFSLFVLCATNQVGGLVGHHIVSLLWFLVCAGLILFVVRHRSTLCSIARICLRELVGLPGIQIVRRRRVKPTFAVCGSCNAFVYNFRFQLPPPILFL
jgi:hypothetical protein